MAVAQHEEQETDELTRTEKLRIAARVLIKRGVAGNGRRWGLQSRLAEHFGVTRQRVIARRCEGQHRFVIAVPVGVRYLKFNPDL